jgi:DNA polymerase V
MLVVDKHSIQTSKYYFNCAVTLPYGSNSTLTIANAACILKKLHAGNEHLKFKKAGVIVTELIDENKKQFDLLRKKTPNTCN